MSKILIVEDDPNNVEILQDLLSDEGYELVTAGNREDAIRSASAAQPDLILMDLQLPISASGDEVDNEAGLGATREIKANADTSNIPIIALTAHNMFHQRERIVEAGCDDLQSKPYDFDALLDTIEKFLA
ncbi:MAG: response regulator [Verrucomicrobiota bacterium]